MIEIKKDDFSFLHENDNINVIHFKEKLLSILKTEEEEEVLLFIVRCIDLIYYHLLYTTSENSVNIWPELIEYIYQYLKSYEDIKALSENKPNILKVRLSLISLFYDVVNNYIQSNKIENNTKDLELTLALLSTNNITFFPEVLNLTVESSFTLVESQMFFLKGHFKMIINLMKQCELSSDYNSLSRCFKYLYKLNESNILLIKPHFSDLFMISTNTIKDKNNDNDNSIKNAMILMEKIFQISDIDFQDSHIEIMLNNTILNIISTLDSNIDENWIYTKEYEVFKETSILGINNQFKLVFINDLFCVNLSRIKKIFEKEIEKLLDNNSDWRYIYVGVFMFSYFRSYISKEKNVQFVNKQIENLKNENPKLRYVSMYCIENSIDDNKTNTSMNKKILVELIHILKEDVLILRMYSIEVISNILSKSYNEGFKEIVKEIIEISMEILDDESIPNNLKELIVLFFAGNEEIVNEDKTNYFMKIEYYDKFVNQFMKIKSDHSKIFAAYMELFAFYFKASNGIFNKIIPEIIESLLSLQENKIESLMDFSFTIFSEISDIIMTEYPQLIEKFIQILINSIKYVQCKSRFVLRAKYNLSHILKKEYDLIVVNDPISIEKENEIEQSMNLILRGCYNIISSKKLDLKEYAELFYKETSTLLSQYYFSSIKMSSLNILFGLSEYFVSTDLNKFKSMFISICNLALNLIDYESNYQDVEMCLVVMDDEIETKSHYFIENDLNPIFENLISQYCSAGKTILNILDENLEKLDLNDACEEENEEEEEESCDDDDALKNYQEIVTIEKKIENIKNVILLVNQIITTFIKNKSLISKEALMKYLDELIPNLIQDHLNNERNYFAILIIDDIIDLGQDYIANEELWEKITKFALKCADIDNDDIKQASMYGLGSIAKHTKSGFEKLSDEILSFLFDALNSYGNFSEEKKKREIICYVRDNIIASIGKSLKYQRGNISNIFLNESIENWLTNLPITHDSEERIEQHEYLIYLLENEFDTLFLQNKNKEKFCREIVRIVNKIHCTEMSESGLDVRIEKIKNQLFNENEEFNNAVIYWEDQNSKIKSKKQAKAKKAKK